MGEYQIRKEKEMKKHASVKVLLLFFALAALVAFASAANAQPGEFVNGVLQPLADGFPKRNITFVVAAETGSSDSIYARSLQAALKGISPVPVIVSDEPASGSFGTFFKLKDLQSREGDKEGYYPVAVTVWGAVGDLHVEPITEELGLDVTDMNMVIITYVAPYVFAQRKNAPWGPTFADFVKFAKANPGKARYISNQIATGNDTAGEWVMQTLGIPKVNKIPQQSSQSSVGVVAAGEGDFTFVSIPYCIPHYEAGRLDITMFIASAVPPPWDKNPNIVSSVQAGLPPVPMGILRGFAVNKTVPPSHVEWLYKLVKAGALTDVHQQLAKTTPGLVIDIMGPAEANAVKMKLYDYAGDTIRSIGLHKDQQKK
jgi:tripartite-type tricarboxylate transporter receptor subunit TctC